MCFCFHAWCLVHGWFFGVSAVQQTILLPRSLKQTTPTPARQPAKPQSWLNMQGAQQFSRQNRIATNTRQRPCSFQKLSSCQAPLSLETTVTSYKAKMGISALHMIAAT